MVGWEYLDYIHSMKCQTFGNLVEYSRSLDLTPWEMERDNRKIMKCTNMKRWRNKALDCFREACIIEYVDLMRPLNHREEAGVILLSLCHVSRDEWDRAWRTNTGRQCKVGDTLEIMNSKRTWSDICSLCFRISRKCHFDSMDRDFFLHFLFDILFHIFCEGSEIEKSIRECLLEKWLMNDQIVYYGRNLFHKAI